MPQGIHTVNSDFGAAVVLPGSVNWIGKSGIGRSKQIQMVGKLDFLIAEALEEKEKGSNQ